MCKMRKFVAMLAASLSVCAYFLQVLLGDTRFSRFLIVWLQSQLTLAPYYYLCGSMFHMPFVPQKDFSTNWWLSGFRWVSSRPAP